MTKSDLIVIKSTFNKTPGQKYKIEPCKMPNGLYPDHIRKVDANGDMILSDKDKEAMSKGKIFLPENIAIPVEHGTTFDLNDPLQAAQWKAIENSNLIAKDRGEKDAAGNLVIDGGKPIVDKYKNARGRYGLADLYIEHPGKIEESKNTYKKLVYQAQGLIFNDDLSHRITICELLEKDMSHSSPEVIEDYLLTQAEKIPEKIIELYTGTDTKIRLLLLEAKKKNVVVQKSGIWYYADDIVLGGSLDTAVKFLANPENIQVKEMVQNDTFPELKAKKDKEK